MSFTGGCYKEFRYLTERELIARFLHPDLENKPKQEQKKLIEDQSLSNYCCNIDGQYFSDDKVGNFINKIFGNYWHSINVYSTRNEAGSKAASMNVPYYHHVGIVNSCGHGGHDSMGTALEEKHYKWRVEQNKMRFEGRK